MIRCLKTTYKGRKIIAKNNWFSGLTLTIDGQLVAHNKELLHLERDVPLIIHDLETESGTETLRVFVEAIWNIKIAITVDDELIATTHPRAVIA